jgi:hypothetical protein
MIYQQDERRALVRAHRDKDGRPDMNGIDYAEVLDDGVTLLVYFIGKLPKQFQTDQPSLPKYLRIEGGRRIRDIRVLDVDPHVEDSPERDDYLIVNLDRTGDFSTYTVRLVGVDGIDPFYDHADFSFAVNCPSDLDCAPAPCPPPQLVEPEINYLAKDYASFRQLILDRLALIMPDWKERHIPDLGIALVELLAYVGDHLSYYQDAVATEAYLDTARQRISVRRHARLVDYFMHEGCNARAWLCLTILGGNLSLDLNHVYFVAGLNTGTIASQGVLTEEEVRHLPVDDYEIFEPMIRSEFMLREAHNEIHFYTWGQRDCCLPRGTTSASLLDQWVVLEDIPADHYEPTQDQNARGQDKQPDNTRTQMVKYKPKEPPPLDTSKLTRLLDLQEGDVLIFEEMIGPKTGNPADADPLHRCAVRLTKVTRNEDPVVTTKLNVNAYTYDQPTPVVDIEWTQEDALPFALCISAIGPAPYCQYLENISVVRGNAILVDHGRSIYPSEALDTVPLAYSEAECECEGQAADVIYRPGRFQPNLNHTALTFREPLAGDQPKWRSAASLLKQDPRAAVPEIQLREIPASPDDQGQLVPIFELKDLDDPSLLIRQMRDPNSARGTMLRWKLTSTTRRDLEKLKSDESPLPDLVQNVINDLQKLIRTWTAQYDLLSSDPDDLNFVVEIDNEGSAYLRFGDGDLGEQPPAGSSFHADYRVGNGRRGNVGADAITKIVLIDMTLSGVNLYTRNPLPAVGGVDAEPIAEAKLYAPSNFRKQLERAIIADDYARIAEREFPSALQRTAARLAWTGSWYEATVALDAFKSDYIPLELMGQVSRRLERYRRIGHDLQIEPAHYTPLQIELKVCVKRDYLRGHVKAALLDVFSNRVLPSGKLGFFHPDRLTFGEDIYLSQLVAAAQAVEGVASVEVSKLQRFNEISNSEIENGVLPLGPFEVAQVDNDSNFPDRGWISFVMNGGR